MTPLRSRLVAAMFCGAVAVLSTPHVHAQPRQSAGEVSIQGNHLIRDGHPWIPHGYYQIAFEVPPGVPQTKPFWTTASQNYSPKEYVEMRDAGADSVRIQVAQTGMDPQNALFTPQFRDRAIGAIRSARATGLTVIVSVQDETQTGEKTPTDLPNDATRRVWQEIAPVFGHDRGVLFELLNEPRPSPSPQHWQAWEQAMNETIRTVRETGAVNVVVADGLAIGQYLENTPLLSDPLKQVAYASHPYFNQASDQLPTTWDKKFGNFSRRAPVIITEWGSVYYCDANTPAVAVSFLQYLQNHGLGLEVVAWDWQSANFGSAIYDFPNGRFSSFVGLSCKNGIKDHGFGIGKTVEVWYRTGVPPTSPK